MNFAYQEVFSVYPQPDTAYATNYCPKHKRASAMADISLDYDKHSVWGLFLSVCLSVNMEPSQVNCIYISVAQNQRALHLYTLYL